MTKRPRHPRPDGNQAQIKADLKASGFVHIWLNISPLSVKEGGADTLVLGYSLRLKRATLLLVEIKQPGKKLNANEQEFHDDVREKFGLDAPLIVAYSAEDILRWFGQID